MIFNNLKTKIYRTITLPFVLYGCETWSIALREDCRLRLFWNRVLRRIIRFVIPVVLNKLIRVKLIF